MSVPAFAFVEKEISQGILTAFQLHAILHYSEVRDLRKDVMSFRFSSWTKVSLDIAGFAPLLNRFLRQKNSLRFGEKRKKGGRIRKPPFGFTVFKGSGRQYCMQSIPLAVLKPDNSFFLPPFSIHCMQSIPLAVLKRSCSLGDILIYRIIACNPYRLRY